MNQSCSFMNFTVGGLLMSVLFLIVYGTFRCKVCEPQPFNIGINIDAMKDLSYTEKVFYHRAYNLYRTNDVTYLDYAKSVLYPDSLLNNMTKHLLTELYGNTHSESQSSDKSNDVVDDLRYNLVKYFGTTLGKYSVVFTFSGGQALKIIAESLKFDSNSKLFYSSSSNLDILGIRSFASEKGATVKSFDLSNIDINPSELSKDSFHLISLPLVDQFDGTVVSKEQMQKVIALNNSDPFVVSLIDASHYLSCNKLNLTETPFSAVSFDLRNIFGFPNLGVLLIQNDLILKLEKPYFGGGTLVYALPSQDVLKMRMKPSEKFEDGSLPFLNLVAATNGFEFIDHLKIENIHNNVINMTQKLIKIIENVKYEDNKKATVIYGNNQESIISFNFIDKNGNIKSFEPYLASALKNNIQISAGCHNTPGTCFSALKIDENKIESEIENINISSYGSLRLSVGWATTEADINRFNEWMQFVVNKI